MNVMGVDAKITMPRQVREFRSGLDLMVKQARGSLPSNRRGSSMDIYATQQSAERDPRVGLAMPCFGKSNRTQTPVKGIINNDYGVTAETYYM